MTGPISPALPISPGLGPAAASRPAAGGGSFGSLLSDLLNQAHQSQAQVTALEQQVVAGQATDLAQVVIASEKATLTLQLATQMRNKVLEVYQDIMKMPL